MLIARLVSGFRTIMSRRLRRLSATLVALCIAASVLFLASQTETTDRAVAAVDCQPVAGDHMLPDDALLHVPRRAKAPLPLVIAFHGAGGTGPGMADYSGLSDTADAKGFAVLYPTAATKRHFWSLNASMPGDDVNRLRTLLPQAMAAACADPARVFATGVSNGGGFAARVGCELAGTISAIAPVAGGYKALDRCPEGRQTSVLEIHGTADHVVPYAGRASDGAGAVAGFLAGWVAAATAATRRPSGAIPSTAWCASPTAGATRGSRWSICAWPGPITAGRAPTRRGRATTPRSWRPTRRSGRSSRGSQRTRIDARSGPDGKRDAVNENTWYVRPR